MSGRELKTVRIGLLFGSIDMGLPRVLDPYLTDHPSLSRVTVLNVGYSPFREQGHKAPSAARWQYTWKCLTCPKSAPISRRIAQPGQVGCGWQKIPPQSELRLQNT